MARTVPVAVWPKAWGPASVVGFEMTSVERTLLPDGRLLAGNPPRSGPAIASGQDKAQEAAAAPGPTALANAPGAAIPAHQPLALAFEGVDFAYHDDTPVLRDVSFRLGIATNGPLVTSCTTRKSLWMSSV